MGGRRGSGLADGPKKEAAGAAGCLMGKNWSWPQIDQDTASVIQQKAEATCLQ